MSRYKAALLHFIISIIVFAHIVALTAYLLYPSALFFRSGGIQLCTILGLVDCVLGPLLTLIVFNANKRSNTFDMTIVIAIQILALLYGAHAIYTSRPAYFVWIEDRFHLVKQTEIEQKAYSEADEQFRSAPLLGPQLVSTVAPEDVETRNAVVFAELAGLGLQNLPKFYVQIDSHLPIILEKGRTRSDLKGTKERLAQVDKFLATRAGGTPLLFYYLNHQGDIMYLALNAKTGAVVSII